MKHPQLSGIATALAKQGRHGDDTLIHVSRKELETLQKYGDELGIHLTVNPQTGLPEAFNWGGMAGSVGLPLLVIAATAATGGAAAPWMLAAAGAAGGFGGTLAGGGTTDQALMSGVMGGIGGWGMGGIAEGLAQAGTEAAKQAATETATNVAAEQGATSLLGSAGSTIPGVTPGVAYSTPTSLLGSSGSAIPGIGTTATGSGLGAAGNAAQAILPGATTPLTGLSGASAAGNVAGTTLPGATTPLTQQFTQQQLMSKGLDAVTASPSALGNFAMGQAKNIGATVVGNAGVGAAVTPQEQTIVTEPDTSNPYQGEMYMDPATGQWRSRAVKKADGGSVFSDYDAADVEKDGGYAPGGYLNLAGGGEAGLASIGKGVPSVQNPAAAYPDYWTQGVALGPTRRQDGLADGGGVSSAQMRSKMLDEYGVDPAESSSYDPITRKYANRPVSSQAEVDAAKNYWLAKKQGLAAGGGIGDLGGYSDGGRLLRGPGDGISDNIPATIENKRPARLADGEFVIPARAVSELGNGSTEAGSKQLYKMLDRIAQKRKTGKGLAYEASPKKLMPA